MQMDWKPIDLNWKNISISMWNMMNCGFPLGYTFSKGEDQSPCAWNENGGQLYMQCTQCFGYHNELKQELGAEHRVPQTNYEYKRIKPIH